MRATILIDVQQGYIVGQDAVPDATGMVESINQYLQATDELVIQTLDIPTPPFAYAPETGETIWEVPAVLPAHAIPVFPDIYKLYKTTFAHKDSYSGFNAQTQQQQLLYDFLTQEGITTLHIAGLSLDYCVKATAIDSVKHGFETIVNLDYTRPMWPSLGLQAVMDLRAAGVRII